MELELQSKGTRKNVTIEDVVEAVHAMSRPNGPTYLVIKADNGDFFQAAGTDGRYVAESRIVLGEGFVHFRVCRPWPGEDHDSEVLYHSGCSKHPPRKCPIHIRASEVCDITHVEQAAVAFFKTGTRTSELEWRVVSGEFRKKADDDFTISDIPPRSRQHA
jgi:hypothetical protein